MMKLNLMNLVRSVCTILCVSSLMGANWSISQPAAYSTRSKFGGVAGNGMIDVTPSGNGVFQFGVFDNQGDFVSENEMNATVTTYMMGTYSWNANLSAPSNGWTVVNDAHKARIIGDNGNASMTEHHSVTEL